MRCAAIGDVGAQHRYPFVPTFRQSSANAGRQDRLRKPLVKITPKVNASLAPLTTLPRPPARSPIRRTLLARFLATRQKCAWAAGKKNLGANDPKVKRAPHARDHIAKAAGTTSDHAQ
jgi:hypothetical protein